jgi:hypothetical protein
MKPLTWIADRPPTKDEAHDSLELFVTYHNGTVGIEDALTVCMDFGDRNPYPLTVIAWMPRPEPYQPTEKQY